MFVGKKKTALPFPVASHIKKYRKVSLTLGRRKPFVMYIAVLVCVSFITGNSLYLHQCSLRHKYSKVLLGFLGFHPKYRKPLPQSSFGELTLFVYLLLSHFALSGIISLKHSGISP